MPENYFEKLKAKAKNFPDAPGCYLFKNAQGAVLYVGKALSLKKRTASYFNRKSMEHPKTRSLLSQAREIESVLAADENQALLLESNLIKRHRPRYNILLRDDKSYPYLKLTLSEDFPRVVISRRVQADGAKYYGPYPNLKIREILKMINRYFNLCDCNIEIDGKAERACLRHQIGQCPAPCIGLITKKEYGRLVRRVQWFLEGRHEELGKYVKQEMTSASQRQEYEEAAKCRDLLSAIEQMQSTYAAIIPEKRDIDVLALAAGLGKVLASVLQVRQGKVIGHVCATLENELELPLEEALPPFLRQYYSPGVFVPDEILLPANLEPADGLEKWLTRLKDQPVKIQAARNDWRLEMAKMAETNVLAALKEDIQKTGVLKDLQQLLALKNLPRCIACFDISTLQGTFTVGSAVFFKDGTAEKSRYRKFRIKEVQGQDDYRSLREMMSRYLRLLEREGAPPPDLFLIDGGKGQLSAVRGILEKELAGDYGLAALAKKKEEVYIPGGDKPVNFRGDLKARHLLQRIRDESHRFAVGYHRLIRDQKGVSSLLRQVKGIGPNRLRALLNHFDSIKEIQAAPAEKLQTVPGFSRELAHQLFKTFHS